MAQNKIVKGRDNPVIINFDFTGSFASGGLNNFTKIVVGIGGESYNTEDNPDKVIVNGKFQLALMIGDVTNLESGNYDLTVTGYSSTYDNGYELTGADNKKLSSVVVK